MRRPALASTARPVAALAALCAGLWAAPVQAAPVAYVLDPENSWVHFELMHFGTSTIRGRLGPATGSVRLDREAGRGEIGVQVPTGSVSTGFALFDRRIREPDLLASATHPQAWFWALSPRRMRAEIAQAQATLRELSGVAPRWFRAVVGMANPFVSAVLRDQGLARVAWSARGFDALSGDPRRVVARIEAQLAPGAIVLLHEGAKHGNNVQTLALLLQRLQALGYRGVLPEELEVEGGASSIVRATPVAMGSLD